MDADQYEQKLADAVRALGAQPDPPHTLHSLVALAPEFFASADYVGVSLVTGNRIETPAATTELLRQVDEAQYVLGEGPCRDAIRTEETVKVDDLASDPRWPRWGARMVADLAIHSSLSFPLFTNGSASWGALNIYSRRTHGFTEDDVVHGQVVAAMAAVVLARSINEHQLAEALETRTVIGQATGTLMERFGLDAEASFNVLRRLSSHSNLKLRDIATQVVTTRALPEPRTGPTDQHPT
jgi:GAF domain-containing protein